VAAIQVNPDPLVRGRSRGSEIGLTLSALRVVCTLVDVDGRSPRRLAMWGQAFAGSGATSIQPSVDLTAANPLEGGESLLVSEWKRV
jgi:hypothetical protein